jgi:hypothetical protein
MSARLDRPALSEWCRRRLGNEPEQVLFESGYLSQVTGLRLKNGADILVKVRPWQERLTGCGQVQHSLSVSGFPAPPLLVPPERLGQLGFSAEALIHVGSLLATEADSAARFAETMALLVRSAPHPATLSTLAPSPAWVGWDHPAEKLWPAPDDRLGDLNDQPVDRWLDEIAKAIRTQLLALDRPVVIGHGDWYSQNLRWVDRHLHVVHDWDRTVLLLSPRPLSPGKPRVRALLDRSRRPSSVGRRPGCGPAPSTPRRRASSAPIPPPH